MSATPSHMEEQRNLKSLKMIALKGAGVGVGIAVTLSVIAACVYWLQSRPKPWRSDPISAVFSEFLSTAEPPGFGFEFTLTNHTSVDYKLDAPKADDSATDPEGVEFRELDHDAISFLSRGRLRYPVFVPAHQRAEVVVTFEPHNASGMKEILESEGSKKERIKEFMRREETDLGGFVLFDSLRRYEVTFPKGW